MKGKPRTTFSVNPLLLLRDLGQAVWLDFLSRCSISDGALKTLINDGGLSGVTEKVIAGSADYDAPLKVIESRRERAAESGSEA